MLEDFFIPMFLSLLLGALIGVQREIRQQKEEVRDLAGFRTFTFISLLGFLTGYFTINLFGTIWFMLVVLVGVLSLIILSYYVVTENKQNGIGIMTQILAIFAFFIGILISYNNYYISIVLTIVITSILFLGHELHQFAKRLTKTEIFATLKFAIISMVILPILPNKNYSPIDMPIIKNIFLNQNLISIDFLAKLDVFNFYHIWLMVVFVSGIAYIGYILMKYLGSKKGILLTGFLGGFMSSTALTTSFAIQSKKNNHLIMPLAIGVIIACSTMFFRILFEIIILNSNLFLAVLIPLSLMGLIGFLLAIYLLIKFNNKHHKIDREKIKSPFTLGPALTFALIFLIVTFFAKLFSILFGNSGIYLLSFISGITDVDAITISLCNLAKIGSISNLVAALGIVIASATNTMFKASLAYYLGTKDFAKVIFYVFGVILFAGGLTFLF